MPSLLAGVGQLSQLAKLCLTLPYNKVNLTHVALYWELLLSKALGYGKGSNTPTTHVYSQMQLSSLI